MNGSDTSRRESSPEARPLAVACCADNNFAVPLAVTLYSALTHLSAESEVSLYLLNGGISEENKYRLNNVARGAPSPARVNLTWIEPDLASLQGLRVQRWLTRAAYLRLLLPSVLQEGVEKVLYLDSDLVVRRDLMELWNRELDGQALWAVQDFGQPYAAPELGLSRHVLREGGLDEVATVAHTPLRPWPINGQTSLWYDFDPELHLQRKIDFLIVDGPPGETAPMARYPAVPLLKDWLRPGGVILLHDAHRDDERKIAEKWGQELGVTPKLHPVEKGAWIIRT